MTRRTGRGARTARPGGGRPAARQRLRPGRPGAHRRPPRLSGRPGRAVVAGAATAVHRPRRSRRRARRLGGRPAAARRRCRWRCPSRRATTPWRPPGQHVVTIWGQWYPYALADGADWDALAESEAAAARRRRRPLRARVSRTRYSGCTYRHPCSWSANCRCPVATSCTWRWGWPACSASGPRPRCPATRCPACPGLYLAGASTHPGGGVSGNSGRTAARVLLADRRPLARGRAAVRRAVQRAASVTTRRPRPRCVAGRPAAGPAHGARRAARPDGGRLSADVRRPAGRGELDDRRPGRRPVGRARGPEPGCPGRASASPSWS